MTTEKELPRYRCHKEVWGLQIEKIEIKDDYAIIYPVLKEYAPFKVNRSYILKHNPYAGGYYVIYKDGYKSFSPEDAFEQGYTLIE